MLWQGLGVWRLKISTLNFLELFLVTCIVTSNKILDICYVSFYYNQKVQILNLEVPTV